jgi:hypothetical protein
MVERLVVGLESLKADCLELSMAVWRVERMVF